LSNPGGLRADTSKTHHWLTGPSVRILSPACMFGSRPKSPDEKRYYLLPGQGRGNRRKHRMQLLAAILAGAIFAALLALLMWWTNSIH